MVKLCFPDVASPWKICGSWSAGVCRSPVACNRPLADRLTMCCCSFGINGIIGTFFLRYMSWPIMQVTKISGRILGMVKIRLILWPGAIYQGRWVLFSMWLESQGRDRLSDYNLAIIVQSRLNSHSKTLTLLALFAGNNFWALQKCQSNLTGFWTIPISFLG